MPDLWYLENMSADEATRCDRCEYFDHGTSTLGPHRILFSDCLNRAAPRFQTYGDWTCPKFYPDTTATTGSLLMAHDYRDPNDPYNSRSYHTLKPCIEAGCNDPAGTWWSPLWCFRHNVERMDRIDARFDPLRKAMTANRD